MDELSHVSNEALLELGDRIIKRDENSIVEAVDSLAVVTGVPGNIAERLRTGRLAEECFMRESSRIVDVNPVSILDCRQLGCGFDFGMHEDSERAFEVKGLQNVRGDILFTDREWQEAGLRQENYWLVVVGNLAVDPVARIIRDARSTPDVYR